MQDQMGGLGAQGYEIRTIHFTLEAPEEQEKAKVEEVEAKAKSGAKFQVHASLLHPDRFLHPECFVLPVTYRLVTDHVSEPVFRMNTTDLHCMKIMQEMRHPSILRPQSIIYGENKTHTLLVHPYCGNLVEYFEDLILNKEKSLEDIILSVQIVFRQVIGGIIYLLDHDLYHGDFKLHNTYYYMEGLKPVVKLAHFKDWSDFPDWEADKLKSEWTAIGMALDEVVTLITNIRHKFDLSCLIEMKDLVVELKTGRTTPDQKKELVPRHCLFWSPEKRASVFTYNIGKMLKDKKFISKVIDLFITPDNFIWDENAYFGLLEIMNNHRVTKHQSKYNGLKKTHYLKFVSGSYTHENEFKVPLYKKTVDATLRKCDPGLVLRVMKLVKAYQTEKQNEL